jgi:hypothetical protein
MRALDHDLELRSSAQSACKNPTSVCMFIALSKQEIFHFRVALGG